MRGWQRVMGLRVVASGMVTVALLAGSVGGVASGVTSGVAAQSTPDDDALAPTLDLGAVVLPPDAFPLDDLTIISGRLESASQLVSGAEVEDPDVLFDLLDDAAFRGRHETLYGTVAEEDETQYAWTAQTSVSEFGDADGADAVFAEMAAGAEDADAEVLEFPEYGDQSALTLVTGSDDRLGEFTRFDFVAQVESVHVGFAVSLGETSGLAEDDIDLADLEPVAEALLEQVEVAQQRETGVFFQGPRFIGDDGFTTNLVLEDYLVLDGTFYPHLTDPEPIEGMEDDIVDQYRLQTFGNPEGTEGLETEVALIGEATVLTDADAAVAYIAAISDPDGLAEAGYTEIAPIEEADALPGGDGEVVGFTYEYDLGDGITSTGVQFWVQLDEVVIGVAADSGAGIDADVLLELTDDAVACAEDGEFCAPVAVPVDLAG